jgi:hypothetical protein
MSQPDGTYLGIGNVGAFIAAIFVIILGNVQVATRCTLFGSLDCPTNPLVTMRNIALRNVTSVDSVNKYPGLVLVLITIALVC